MVDPLEAPPPGLRVLGSEGNCKGAKTILYVDLFGHVRQSGELMVGQTEGLLGPVNFKDRSPLFLTEVGPLGVHVGSIWSLL